MMKKLIAVVVASMVAAPAFAGGFSAPVEDPVVAPPVAPVASYRPAADWTGFYAGATLGYGKAEAPDSANKGDGVVGGVQAGYRWQFNNGAVVGLEGQYVGGGTDLTTPGDKLSSVGRVKLQAGGDVGGTLLYATAGAARAEATVGGVKGSDNGYFYGLGIDRPVSSNVNLGAEILRDQFDNFKGTGTDVKNTSIGLRANFKF